MSDHHVEAWARVELWAEIRKALEGATAIEFKDARRGGVSRITYKGRPYVLTLHAESINNRARAVSEGRCDP